MAEQQTEVEELEAAQFRHNSQPVEPVAVERDETLNSENDQNPGGITSEQPEFIYSPEDLRRLSIRDDLIDWAEGYIDPEADESLRRNKIAEMIGKLETDYRQAQIEHGVAEPPPLFNDTELERCQFQLMRLANDYQRSLKCITPASEGGASRTEKQLALALTLAAGGVHNPDSESRLPEGLKFKIVPKERLPEDSRNKMIVEVNGEYLVSEEGLQTQKNNERLVDSIEVALGWKEEDSELGFDPEVEGGYEETDPRAEWEQKIEDLGGIMRDLKLFYRFKGKPAAFVLAKFIVDLSDNKAQFDTLNSLQPGSTEWALSVARKEYNKIRADSEAQISIPAGLISKKVFGEHIASSRELYDKIAQAFAGIDLDEFFAADDEELTILDADAGTDESAAGGEEEAKAPETKKQEGGAGAKGGSRADRWKVPTLGETIKNLYAESKNLIKAVNADIIAQLDPVTAILGKAA